MTHKSIDKKQKYKTRIWTMQANKISIKYLIPFSTAPNTTSSDFSGS